jgi:hypothetical protein
VKATAEAVVRNILVQDGYRGEVQAEYRNSLSIQTCVQLIGHQVKFDSILERSTSAQALKTQSTIQRGTMGYLRELAFQAVEHREAIEKQQRSKEQ